MSPLTESTRLTLRKTWQPMDTDAAAYIAAVETADGQALEERTKIAIDNFVLGCKADGIWTAIKASCILAGARTLAGALVPLVGTAPTNNNFVSGDYVRKTGLVGNGSNKALNSNRAQNTDPQNSSHFTLYLSASSTNASGTYGWLGGAGNGSASYTALNRAFNVGGNDSIGAYSRTAAFRIAGPRDSVGLIGVSRSNGVEFTTRVSNANTVIPFPSSTPNASNIYIFGLNDNGSISFSSPRLAFYSIGESLDLQKLDSRVTDLITAFGVAIP